MLRALSSIFERLEYGGSSRVTTRIAAPLLSIHYECITNDFLSRLLTACACLYYTSGSGPIGCTCHACDATSREDRSFPLHLSNFV